MKMKQLIVVGALFAAVVSAPLFLASARTADEHGGNEKIEHAMEDLNGSLKRLDKALAGKDVAAALPLVLKMQQACQDSKGETPVTADAIKDEKKKAEFVAGYRKQMIEVQKALLDVEAALVDGKADDAAKLLAEKVKPAKKTGHDAYKGD